MHHLQGPSICCHALTKPCVVPCCLPLWPQAAYNGLAEQGLESSRCPPSSQAVALALLPSYLSLYQQPGASASAALTAQQLQLTQASAAAVSSKLTHDRFGLLSVEPSCMYPGSAGPERADITLNAWAAWLAEQALNGAAVGGSSGRNAGALSAAWGSVQGAAKTWRKALETQLVADAVSARRGSRYSPPAAYSDLETLSWVRLVLGPTWAPTVTAPQNAAANAPDVSAEVKKDLSMQRLTAAALAGNLTVGGQARVGLALLKDPKAAMGSYGGKQLSAAAAVQRISSRLTSNIRVGGRTAYIATGEGQRSAAGMVGVEGSKVRGRATSGVTELQACRSTWVQLSQHGAYRCAEHMLGCGARLAQTC